MFQQISKHQEESWKYDAQRIGDRIFDEIRGVWKSDVTLLQVFDIFFSIKKKLY